MSWETLCLWTKKHVSVTSVSLIPWNMRPISFSIALVHFVLSVPFIGCLYSWDFPISGEITAFVCPGWIVTYTVVLLVFTQSSTVMCTMYVGTDVGGGLGGGISTTWLAIRL